MAGCRGLAAAKLSQVPTIMALRKRMPFIVFVLLLVLVVMMVGFACACLGGQPGQTLGRSADGPPALPPLIELWALLTVLLVPASFVLARRIAETGRASPATLQRFLI